ncbi:hypothetical protein AAG906_005301 [Vitis piasezkii]
MPFGLCNAPATFQRCMLSIFSDMVERIMEVFMDDITVYGSSYEECLMHLEAFSTIRLKRCLDLNELEEMRNDAYLNSKIAKARLKNGMINW